MKKLKLLFLTVLLLQVNAFSQKACSDLPTVIYSGKTYNTVQIGSQCWLKENLDVGTMINGNKKQSNNSTIEKYCYDDISNNCAKYGGLYQWDEAMQYLNTEGAQGICPPGWHIPTYKEIEQLAIAVSKNGNTLKAIGEGKGDGAGTNLSGFSLLLSGTSFRENRSNNFYNFLNEIGYFWSSSEESKYRNPIKFECALYFYVYYNSSGIESDLKIKVDGVGVRCIKDIYDETKNKFIGDKENNNKVNEVPVYLTKAEVMPEPIGGISAIYKNIIYPEIAKRAGVEGTVKVLVFIDEAGTVTDLKIIKGIGAGCDEAAIDAVKKAKFKPGIQGGKTVNVQVLIPLEFKIQ